MKTYTVDITLHGVKDEDYERILADIEDYIIREHGLDVEVGIGHEETE